MVLSLLLHIHVSKYSFKYFVTSLFFHGINGLLLGIAKFTTSSKLSKRHNMISMNRVCIAIASQVVGNYNIIFILQVKTYWAIIIVKLFYYYQNWLQMSVTFWKGENQEDIILNGWVYCRIYFVSMRYMHLSLWYLSYYCKFLIGFKNITGHRNPSLSQKYTFALYVAVWFLFH